MVLTAKVAKKDAQTIKEYLEAKSLLLHGVQHGKDEEHVYFPVTERFRKRGVQFDERELASDERVPSWRDAAKRILTEEEYETGRFSYDTVGAIAIVEIVAALVPKELVLADLLLRTNPTIKTVLKKAGGHEGEFRTQTMIHLAGDDTRETVVRENGCEFLINVETVYFSIRLGTERARISKLVRPGEEILCMFSGAAPYPVVLSKNTRAKSINGVEINPEGHRYGLENIKRNKAKNVELFCGDVNTIVPEIIEGGRRFDRITMPLPHTGHEFLPLAISALKPNGTIHYYSFVKESEIPEEERRVNGLIKKSGRKGKVAAVVRCGQHAPHVFRICCDIVAG